MSKFRKKMIAVWKKSPDPVMERAISSVLSLTGNMTMKKNTNTDDLHLQNCSEELDSRKTPPSIYLFLFSVPYMYNTNVR